MEAPAGGFAAIQRFLVRPIVPEARTRTYELLLIAWFTALTSKLLVHPQLHDPLHPPGVDSIVYTHAARALLEGENPWRVSVTGIFYGAPPPSLIPYLPFVWLPDAVIAFLGVAVGLLSAVYALRRLHMPLWWLLFPPVAISIFAGSSALPMLALLIRGGVLADAAAIVTRVYAALLLAALRRWQAVVAAGIAIVLSAPFNGWATYFADREHVMAVFDAQAGAGVSATAIPMLVPLVAVLLILVGRRRAAWLLVPFLWPSAQHHYASMALPVLGSMPLVAAGLAPYSAVLGVAGLAAHVAAERLRIPSGWHRRIRGYARIARIAQSREWPGASTG